MYFGLVNFNESKFSKDCRQFSMFDNNINQPEVHLFNLTSYERQFIYIKRESVKLKGSVKKGKQEPKNHHQSQHSPNSYALFATDSLELKLAHTAINEHTNTH